MPSMRVFLVDDHLVFRESLALLIDAQSDMAVVGQASDGRSVFEAIHDCEADVVIMDVSMSDVNGIQATAQVRQECPNVQIVALTRHGESGYINQMFRAGAHGYVLKQSASQELINAIRAVAAGGMYVDSTLTSHIVHHFVQGRAEHNVFQTQDLSERETDVVRLTALGHSNAEIASQLGINVKTVDTYKMRAMEKLGLHSRVGLVRYALECGWLDQS